MASLEEDTTIVRGVLTRATHLSDHSISFIASSERLPAREIFYNNVTGNIILDTARYQQWVAVARL